MVRLGFGATSVIFVGHLLLLVGAVVLLVVAPILSLSNGEAFFGAAAAAVTLMVAGGLLVSNKDSAWPATAIGLYLFGAFCAALGGGLAIRLLKEPVPRPLPRP